MRDAKKKSYIEFVLAFQIFSLTTFFEVPQAEASVTTTVASIYLDAPFVQGSYATHHGGVTETFDSGTAGSVANNTSLAGGTKATGTLTRFAAGQVFGAINNTETATVGNGGMNPFSINTGFANTNTGGFELTFSTSVKYIGFYWAAGNTGNTVEFYSDTTLIGTFATDNLTATLGSVPASYSTSTDSITATNGSHYLKKYYFGSPAGYATTTPTSAQANNVLGNEPFAFIHIFAQNNQSFNKLIIKGNGFEFDNLTTSTQSVPIRTSLHKLQDATTTRVLGRSAWSFQGVTSSDGSVTSSNWTSESTTATSANSIEIKQTLTIDSGDVSSAGTTALFQANLNDTSTISCGSYSRVDTFTATNDSFRAISILNTGSASSTQLIRGFCYVWTTNPSSSYGIGAVRPTGSASGSIFNSNLDSPVLYLPKLPDVKMPESIPIIASNSSVKFPSTKVTQGAGQIQACFFENDGSSLNGSWGTRAGNQNLSFRSGSIVANPFNATSSSTTTSLFNDLTITRTSGTKFSTNRYILVRLVPYLGTQFTYDCSGSGSGSGTTFTANLWPNSSNVYLITLKAIDLKRTHGFTIAPRNGRQN